MSDIHSCSYFCDRPECIRRQRDELRERYRSNEGEAMSADRGLPALPPLPSRFKKGWPPSEDDMRAYGRQCWDAALSAQREAMPEPVGWLHHQGNYTEACDRRLDQWELENGWTEEPLYTAPPQPAGADERTAFEAAHKIEQQALYDAMALAYGYLWHVNNEPGTPAMLYSPEKAAYTARQLLRGYLSNDERGKGINAARAALSRGET